MTKKIDVAQMQADLGNFSSEYETIRHDDLMQVLSRLEKAEEDRDKLMNRLDAMRRQRDGYRNRLRKTEQQVQTMHAALVAIQELHKPQLVEDFFNAIDGSSANRWMRVCSTCDTVDYPCATRRLADQGLGDNLARTTKNGDNNV